MMNKSLLSQASQYHVDIHDDRTPPEGITGRKSLQAHDEALVAVAVELAGFSKWRELHEAAHITLTEIVEEIRDEQKAQGKQVKAINDRVTGYTDAVKRGTVSTRRIAAYAGAVIGIVGAIGAGGAQIVAAIGSNMTSEARAQSTIVSEQKNAELTAKSRLEDVQRAAEEGFRRGATEQNRLWMERRVEEARVANRRTTKDAK